MKKLSPKHIEVSRVGIIFALLVFSILVVTMAIVGGVIYLMFRRNALLMNEFETLWTLTLTFLVASVIIGTLISIITAKVILKNMDNVVKGMEELSKGKYKVRIPEVKAGIGKEIVDSFNILASELENTHVLRSDFINDYAHEFKTPIVSLLGFAKLLQKENLTDEQRKEYLSVIEEEAERLSAMSTNSLYLTRVDKQTILTDVVEFNLSEQIRNCVLLFEKKWTAKELELDLDFDEFIVSGNEEMLKQVWINLIDNAIKFSNKSGKIEIGINKKEKFIHVTVKNSGVEIGESEKEKIFNRFYRTEKTQGIEGTGVGLAIVKKIVDLHKGSVFVDSVNGYTTFEVILPC